MHPVLEFFPLVLFLIVYKMYGIYWGTASLIVSSVIQILIYVIRKKPIPKMNWIVLGMITFFGGLTIYFHDDAFIKWKVTVINEFFALALLVSNHVFKKNLIKQFLGEALTLPEKIWTRLNFSWAMFFAICGLLNIYIAFNFDQDTWVNFKVFGLTGLTLVFSVGSIAALYKYLPQDEPEAQDATIDNANKNQD